MSRKVVTCRLTVAVAYVERAREEDLQKLLQRKLDMADLKIASKGYQWTQDWQLVVRYHPPIHDADGYPIDVDRSTWMYVYEREYSDKNHYHKWTTPNLNE